MLLCLSNHISVHSSRSVAKKLTPSWLSLSSHNIASAPGCGNTETDLSGSNAFSAEVTKGTAATEKLFMHSVGCRLLLRRRRVCKERAHDRSSHGEVEKNTLNVTQCWAVSLPADRVKVQQNRGVIEVFLLLLHHHHLAFLANLRQHHLRLDRQRKAQRIAADPPRPFGFVSGGDRGRRQRPQKHPSFTHTREAADRGEGQHPDTKKNARLLCCSGEWRWTAQRAVSEGHGS